MVRQNLDDLAVGDAIPTLTLPAITRTTLALFAGASGDHNPIHIDSDFARAAGLPDVIGHGMLSMAWLGMLLTEWVPQSWIRKLDVRFIGICGIGTAVTCSGVIARIDPDGVYLALKAVDQTGEEKLVGEALIAIPQAHGKGEV
nr:MaoC/PaaZ C-terminal domain-containing protein [uncultured Pseudomonas sp.]